MARAKQVVARKDYPQFGITKGQTHYHWSLMTGPRSSREFRQVAPPKRSQLTTSDYLGQLYDLLDGGFEGIEDADALRGIAEDFRALGQEQQDKLDGMPEGLQQGDTGQRLQERADACEAAADEIDQAADDLESEQRDIEYRLAEWTKFRAAHPDAEDHPDEPEGEELDEDDAGSALADALGEAIEAAEQAASGADC